MFISLSGEKLGEIKIEIDKNKEGQKISLFIDASFKKLRLK